MFEKMNLFNKASIKILAFLSKYPMSEFYEREIARKANVSVGAANQALKLLSENGLVIREKRGKMHFYKLNLKNPIVRQFKVLLNTIELNELINGIKGVSKKIVLFGSAATGEDTNESDIDLLIITNEKEKIRKKITQLGKTLDRKLSPIVVNYNEFLKLKKENKALVKNIERGIVLWEM